MPRTQTHTDSRRCPRRRRRRARYPARSFIFSSPRFLLVFFALLLSLSRSLARSRGHSFAFSLSPRAYTRLFLIGLLAPRGASFFSFSPISLSFFPVVFHPLLSRSALVSVAICRARLEIPRLLPAEPIDSLAFADLLHPSSSLSLCCSPSLSICQVAISRIPAAHARTHTAASFICRQVFLLRLARSSSRVENRQRRARTPADPIGKNIAVWQRASIGSLSLSSLPLARVVFSFKSATATVQTPA